MPVEARLEHGGAGYLKTKLPLVPDRPARLAVTVRIESLTRI
jgi:hypothetical protein